MVSLKRKRKVITLSAPFQLHHSAVARGDPLIFRVVGLSLLSSVRLLNEPGISSSDLTAPVLCLCDPGESQAVENLPSFPVLHLFQGAEHT